MKSEKSEVKTRFEDYYIELVVFLTGIGQALYLPGRHIPIDTSLCSQSPQVRIYGFVAAGSTPSRANMEDETHTTYRTLWAFKQMRHKEENSIYQGPELKCS